MAIQGMRDTSNFATDERPKHWRATVLRLYPNGKAPLYALTSAMKSESVDDPEFNWWEKSMQTRRMLLGGNLDNTGGSEAITLVSGALTLTAGTLLLVEETGEILHVDSDPSVDTSVTVTRSWGDVAATAVTYNGAGVNDNILVIGTAMEEGSNAPTAVGYDPVKVYNYTQIFRNTLEHTRTAMRTRLRTGDAVKEAQRECLELHSRDIEWAFFKGNKVETTKNGKPVRSTGGIESFLAASNIESVASGNLDMDALEGYMERIFAYGANEKIAFMGNRAITAINTCIRKNSSYQLMDVQKEYGMDVTRLVCPHGTLVLKSHPLFNQVPGGTNTGGGGAYYGMNTYMYVIDAANLVYRYTKGDDTRYQAKLQDSDLDGEKSGYITECGLEVQHADTHFLIKDLNAGIADS